MCRTENVHFRENLEDGTDKVLSYYNYCTACHYKGENIGACVFYIRNCPHCGSMKVFVLPINSKAPISQVFCYDCAAKGPLGLTAKTAVFAWNQMQPGEFQDSLCPYCPRSDLIIGHDSCLDEETLEEGSYYFIFCKYCGCEGPMVFDEDDALEQWNRRISMDDLKYMIPLPLHVKVVIERVEKRLDYFLKYTKTGMNIYATDLVYAIAHEKEVFP